MENIEIWEGKHFFNVCENARQGLFCGAIVANRNTHSTVRDKLLDDACNFPRCSAEVFEMIPN